MRLAAAVALLIHSRDESQNMTTELNGQYRIVGQQINVLEK